MVVEGTGTWTEATEHRFELPDPPEDDSFLHILRVAPGDEFPDVALVDRKGRATTFGAARDSGRSTLVNLWATYCVPCRKEMPELEALSRGYAEAGLDIVGVSLDMGAAQRAVPRQLKKLGVTYPIFTTDERIFPTLFAGDEIFIPLTYFVDAEGIVVDVFKGWSPQTQERIESLIHAPTGAHASP